MRYTPRDLRQGSYRREKMANHRVSHYEVTYCDSSGMQYTRTRRFTQAQADEVGAVLETDGETVKRILRRLERAN